jgi:hypothetical protein
METCGALFSEAIHVCVKDVGVSMQIGTLLALTFYHNTASQWSSNHIFMICNESR